MDFSLNRKTRGDRKRVVVIYKGKKILSSRKD